MNVPREPDGSIDMAAMPPAACEELEAPAVYAGFDAEKHRTQYHETMRGQALRLPMSAVAPKLYNGASPLFAYATKPNGGRTPEGFDETLFALEENGVRLSIADVRARYTEWVEGAER